MIPLIGKENDSGLCHSLGIYEGLQAVSRGQFFVFGDSAFKLGPQVMKPFPVTITNGEAQFNHAGAITRVSVEICFAIVKNRFPLLRAFDLLRVDLSPISRWVFAAFFLSNCISCLHANEVSSYFALPPPSLAEFCTV
jgi:hypothetical protein